jgi:DNA-binding winged helix-turn-helix (wHTH) protein
MAHGDRSVDVFIRKLRQKLEKLSPSWGYIHTHFGVGYRFDPEPLDGAVVEAPVAEPSAHPVSESTPAPSATIA